MHSPFYSQSSASRACLRIGVLFNDGRQPAWVAEVLWQIAQSNFAKVELAVYNAKQVPRRTLLTSILDMLRDAKVRRGPLFRLYARWDRRRIRGESDPFQKKDVTDLLGEAAVLRVNALSAGPVDRFPADAIESIRAMNLDVLLRFGFNILRGDILTAARYGVWSYHHGDNEFYRGGPPCFWEMVEGNQLTGAMLQVLTEDLDAGRILCRGFFATRAGGSWVRNRVQPYWGASTFVIEKLRQLHEQGWEKLERDIAPPQPYRGKRKIYKAPTNVEMARWLARRFAAQAVAAVTWLPRRLRTDYWKLGIHVATETQTGSAPAQDISQFRWIEPPRGHFYADPFLFRFESRRWLFFEDFDYRTRLGTIAAAEVMADGKMGPPIRVLERPYHLSYPCVFQVDGQVFMIPESRANGTVEMYRCRKFPCEWEPARVCLEASAVDTTVWSENGVHWFFVTLREARGGALQLWLFSSTGIEDEWRPHPANPISTDVRSSRGAGAIFRDGGRLIRPSQDCSGNYGRSFTLNEILVLNENEYREQSCVTVEAPHGMIGTHTYARLGEMEVVDGCAWASVFSVMGLAEIWTRVRRKLRLT